MCAQFPFHWPRSSSMFSDSLKLLIGPISVCHESSYYYVYAAIIVYIASHGQGFTTFALNCTISHTFLNCTIYRSYEVQEVYSPKLLELASPRWPVIVLDIVSNVYSCINLAVFSFVMVPNKFVSVICYGVYHAYLRRPCELYCFPVSLRELVFSG